MRRIISLVVCVGLVGSGAWATGAEGKLTPEAKLSGQIAKARKRVAKAKGLVVEGFNTLQRARASGDNGRVQCVNSALTQMKGLLRLADNSILELQEAVSNTDVLAGERNAVKVKIATSKVSDANRRLQACMGNDDAKVIGAAPVILVEPDPDLPNVDPTEGLKDLSSDLQNTVSASPFFG